MAKWLVGDGLTEYLAQMQILDKNAEYMIKSSIYEGAKIVADEFKRQINAIPKSAARAAEKQGLLDGFGISPFQKTDGVINVKVGFDGYNSVKTKTYPQGQPNSLIARSVKSGSPYRASYDFATKAINAARSRAEAAMVKKFDENIKKLEK